MTDLRQLETCPLKDLPEGSGCAMKFEFLPPPSNHSRVLFGWISAMIPLDPADLD
jgi:hypothetical protein